MIFLSYVRNQISFSSWSLVVWCNLSRLYKSRPKMYCSIIYIVHCRYESYLNYRVATRQKRISSVSSINLLLSFSFSLSLSLSQLSRWNMLLNSFYFGMLYMSTFSRWLTFTVIFSLISRSYIDLARLPSYIKDIILFVFLWAVDTIFSTYHLFYF